MAIDTSIDTMVSRAFPTSSNTDFDQLKHRTMFDELRGIADEIWAAYEWLQDAINDDDYESLEINVICARDLLRDSAQYLDRSVASIGEELDAIGR